MGRYGRLFNDETLYTFMNIGFNDPITYICIQEKDLILVEENVCTVF